MSDASKKLARAIVNVVKQNNKLLFYTAESSVIPSKIVSLEGVRSVDVTREVSSGVYGCRSYDVRFRYDPENPRAFVHVTFPCGGTEYVWNSTSKQYDAVRRDWEKEAIDAIQAMTKLI